MMAKYKIEYSIPFNRHAEHLHYLTNDPVACEEFLTELLEGKFKIRNVLHEGVELPRVDFDRMIKTAAGVLAAKHICTALGIDSTEARHRFGSPA